MNTLLEKLFLENTCLTEKDKYEIRQIFNFVDDTKKQNILKNFGYIVSSIKKIKSDLIENQEILLGRAITNIENSINIAKISGIKNATNNNIKNLKQTI